jgi:hypothetical protein
MCIGKHSTTGTPLPIQNSKNLPFLSASPPNEKKESFFLAIIPIPDEESEWSFNH